MSTWVLVVFVWNGSGGVSSGDIPITLPGFSTKQNCLLQGPRVSDAISVKRFGAHATSHRFICVEAF